MARLFAWFNAVLCVKNGLVLFHLGQVEGPVVGEPAVSGAKALGLGSLGVSRDGEAARGRFERSRFGANQAWGIFGTR